MRPQREQIIAALEALLLPLISSGYKTVTRDVELWNSVPAEAQPSLMISEPMEKTTRSGPSALAKTELTFDLFIYAKSDSKPNTPRASVLNALLDALDLAIAPVGGGDIVRKRQTLGGLVENCYVDGTIIKDNGYLDGQAVAVVPLKTIVP